MTDSPAESSKGIAVAVDAMGGDKAPQAIVEGTRAAARALPHVQVILVGDTVVVTPVLQSIGDIPPNLRLVHASQVVTMEDSPGAAIRHKSDSSISVGMRLVRDGEAQAFVSAGNSGAMMAAGMLILKPQPGVDRPAIATLFPTKTGQVILLDAGATTDCKPSHLVQFARMGSLYAAAMFDRARPRVGLLSIGEEPTKGDELTKETHKLLLTSDVNFVGNVEPKELVRGEVDVVVCDGFVGNLILKAGEGVGELIMDLIGTEIRRDWWAKLAALCLKPAFRRVKKRFAYEEYGGALLLGVNGVVIIGHGRSSATAIENAVCRIGVRAVQGHLADALRANAAAATVDVAP